MTETVLTHSPTHPLAAPMTKPPPTLRWSGGTDGHLVLLDQTRLPGEVVELACRTVEDVWEAIRSLRVRGAPAIGIAAAYGVVLAATEKAEVSAATDRLATSRPTAVNLFWALNRMRTVADSVPSERDPQELAEQLLDEGRQVSTTRTAGNAPRSVTTALCGSQICLKVLAS